MLHKFKNNQIYHIFLVSELIYNAHKLLEILYCYNNCSKAVGWHTIDHIYNLTVQSIFPFDFLILNKKTLQVCLRILFFFFRRGHRFSKISKILLKLEFSKINNSEIQLASRFIIRAFITRSQRLELSLYIYIYVFSFYRFLYDCSHRKPMYADFLSSEILFWNSFPVA